VILRRPAGMAPTLSNFNCVAIGSPKTRTRSRRRVSRQRTVAVPHLPQHRWGGSGRRFPFSGMVRLGAATQRVIFAILAASSKAGGKRRTAAAAMRRVLTRLKKDDLVWLTDTDALRKAPARIEVSPRALPINRSCGEVIMTISGVVRDRRAVGPARGASYAFNQRPPTPSTKDRFLAFPNRSSRRT
jgi:hypothetical protein